MSPSPQVSHSFVSFSASQSAIDSNSVHISFFLVHVWPDVQKACRVQVSPTVYGTLVQAHVAEIIGPSILSIKMVSSKMIHKYIVKSAKGSTHNLLKVPAISDSRDYNCNTRSRKGVNISLEYYKYCSN